MPQQREPSATTYLLVKQSVRALFVIARHRKALEKVKERVLMLLDGWNLPFTDQDFTYITEVARKHAGIDLGHKSAIWSMHDCLKGCGLWGCGPLTPIASCCAMTPRGGKSRLR
jgi:hypothetical protein